MTTIFISGSREIPYVPDEVRERIDRIISSEFDIVIGDSEHGVDAAIASYLAFCQYKNVTVYTVHDRPRLRSVLDAWNVRTITPTVAAKTDGSGNISNRREMETEKDQAMGNVANYGLVIWQSTYTNRFGNRSASKGSLRNMYQLISSRKPVVLYKAGVDDFMDISFDCHELKSVEALDELVSAEPPVVQKAYAAIKKMAAQQNPQLF